MNLINNIFELKANKSLSKHDHIVQGVITSINEGELVIGDQLPSINVMVKEIGYARKTIVKAYEDLKDRGLVESKKLKGYFIVSKQTKVRTKIALLLYAFHSFQEEFYNTLRNELGKRYHIDVFFHHNNVSVFETIFSNIQSKYGLYVIAPIPVARIKQLLQRISPTKLLIIDRYIDIGNDYSYVSQEFEKTTYEKLVQLSKRIKKYKKIILLFREDADYPIGIHKAFNKFVDDYGINGFVSKKYKTSDLKKGTLFFMISDTFLWEVLRDCRHAEYIVGKDIGILSHNDHIVKQFVFGGITTISADFSDMAVKAAEHIKTPGLKTQTIVPFNLMKRNSL